MSLPSSLPPELEQRLDALVQTIGGDKASYFLESIERGLEDIEDYYMASAVLTRVQTGEEVIHSSAEVRAELGLDD